LETFDPSAEEVDATRGRSAKSTAGKLMHSRKKGERQVGAAFLSRLARKRRRR